MDRIPSVVKVDLHVHSAWSNQPYNWFLRSANAAECYTSVANLYEIATKRGMDLVTISDHDTIHGALELVGKYPGNTFISEEVSARFPEDGCVVHTIAVNISEAQHQELQRLRRNIYELIAYMQKENISYFWCHPLSHVNHRLTRSHIERCFLMFRAVEIRNGTRDSAHEANLKELIDQITPARLAGWADRYPEVPLVNLDGEYARVGGSDDHGSIAIARAFTRFRGDASADGLCAALRSRTTAAGGNNADAAVLAHNCYGVTAGFLRATGQLGGSPSSGSNENGTKTAGASGALISSLLGYKRRLEEAGIELRLEDLFSRGHTDEYQHLLQAAATEAFVHGWRAACSGIASAMENGRVADAANATSDLVKGLLIELPYILASRYQVRDRNTAHRFYRELGGSQSPARTPRVAVISDTVDSIDGVALGLRRLCQEAKRWAFDLRLIGTGENPRVLTDADGVVRIPSIYSHRLAEQPDYVWSLPHLPSLLTYLSDERIDLIQCATPGPLGFAALLAGRLMGIPVIGQYHTDVPEYALHLTGDSTVASIVEKVVGWFYSSLDHVLVPSHWVSDIVTRLGVAPDKVCKIARGIDLELFSPSRRDPGAFREYGVERELTILYVGRLSREKSIHCLLSAFRLLPAAGPDARLILVGDGPHADELKKLAASDRVVFAGAVRGQKLARLYASCDIFVSPSETETFGNTVVEAQAAGVPVIVSNRGAAQEHVIQGTSGFVVDVRDHHALASMMARLLDDESLRRAMGAVAHRYAKRYDIVEAVRSTFREYARFLGERPGSVGQNDAAGANRLAV